MASPPGQNSPPASEPAAPVPESQRRFMDNPEIVVVTTRKVACDGVGGALGHPKVFLEMGDEHFVECPYCDKRFNLKPGAGHH